MIQINFKQKNLDDFVKHIEPKLRKRFNSILKNKRNEEHSFLVFLRDQLDLKNIIMALPNDFTHIAGITMDNIENQINEKKFELRKQIIRTVTPSNFRKYLFLLKGDELKRIINKHSIKTHKATKKEQFIKAINKYTFNKQDKINFEKEYFILRANKFCKEIFEDFYLTEWDNILDFDKYHFVKKLDLKSCPYCNRNYIFIVENDKIRPEIDHFYPKSKYPFFAMSFFNLIPSCPLCNHTKSSKFELNMVNPYSDFNNNSINFSIDIENINFLDVKKNKYDFDSFRISINSSNNINIDIFKLEKLYEQHKDTILELLVKYKYYPSQYISYLRTYGFSEDEIYRYLFNNYSKDKDLHRRPLSKLIKDIATKLKLIR